MRVDQDFRRRVGGATHIGGPLGAELCEMEEDCRMDENVGKFVLRLRRRVYADGKEYRIRGEDDT